jgi:hypothetical protein
MTTRLTFPASMFSVVCQRCGSTVRKNADSCPNCGADRNAAFGPTREAAPGKPRTNVFEEAAAAPLASAAASASTSSASMGSDAGERVEPGMRSRWTERASERIAQKAAEYRTRRAEESARNAYAESGNDPDALPGSERWSTKKTIIAGACGLVLLLGAMFYYQLGDSDGGGTSSDDHSVSGAIDSKAGSLMRGATDAPGTAPVTAERRAPSDARALASGDTLQGVRIALEQHDLATARARLRVLPAQQQARADYETLKDELVKRESQRDAALQLARACERTSAWACVQQNAGEALALDGSNMESQAMLERVVSHAGWLAPTAAAALAKRVPGAAPPPAVANAPDTSNTTNAAATQPKPGAGVPAQANVAAVTPATRPGALAQKPATERRASQRNAAAARQADDEAYESHAEKIARAQAATAAITSTTVTPVTPPAAPTVATTMTRPAQTSTQAAAPAPSQPAAKTAPAPVTQAARTPYYLGDEDTPPPAATNNARAANTRAPYYLGDEPQPAARPANPRGAYYLGEDPPQPSAPATRAAVPRPPQSGSQSSSAPPPSTATMQAAVPRPPAAATQPVAPTAAAPRVPQVVSQPVAQTNASPRSTPTSAGASPQFANMPAGSHLDSDKSEELERAIKQYGWSGGDPAAKPSR